MWSPCQRKYQWLLESLKLRYLKLVQELLRRRVLKSKKCPLLSKSQNISKLIKKLRLKILNLRQALVSLQAILRARPERSKDKKRRRLMKNKRKFNTKKCSRQKLKWKSLRKKIKGLLNTWNNKRKSKTKINSTKTCKISKSTNKLVKKWWPKSKAMVKCQLKLTWSTMLSACMMCWKI